MGVDAAWCETHSRRYTAASGCHMCRVDYQAAVYVAYHGHLPTAERTSCPVCRMGFRFPWEATR